MALFNYFKFQNDIDTIRDSSDKVSKVLAGGKILAKGIANIGIYALTEMPVHSARQILNNENATEEQKERAREFLEKYESMAYESKFSGSDNDDFYCDEFVDEELIEDDLSAEGSNTKESI